MMTQKNPILYPADVEARMEAQKARRLRLSPENNEPDRIRRASLDYWELDQVAPRDRPNHDTDGVDYIGRIERTGRP